MNDKENDLAILEYSKEVIWAEELFEKHTANIVKLFPTREDLKRNRGTICICFLETKGEATILAWITFQELKKELIGDRRCMKNQTAEEREIIAKGLRIDKCIKNHYKKLSFKCYNRFTEKTREEKAKLIYQQMRAEMFPDRYKRVL